MSDPRELFERASHAASAGRHEEAVVELRRAAELAPDVSVIRFNLGNSLLALGQLEDAAHAFQSAAAIDDDPDAWNNLGLTLARLRRWDQAADAFQNALRQVPDAPSLLANLGQVQIARREWDAALESFARWLELEPSNARAHDRLAFVWHEKGVLDKAEPAYRRALEIDETLRTAHVGLGATLAAKGKLTEAQQHYAVALAQQPQDARVVSNVGHLQVLTGDISAALDSYRQALAWNPRLADTHSNLLLAMQYRNDVSDATLLTESRRWAAEHTDSLTRVEWPTVLPAHMDRRLRIGYVSSDLRNHPIGLLLNPVVQSHDRQRYELFCYASQTFFDDVSYRLYESAENWRVVGNLSDEALAAQIHTDGIDILVDLNGHTSNHRLGVFARRPAPVQASWLGYLGTTGLSEIDYLLADSVVVPAEDESHYVERIARLPHAMLCYEPPHLDVAVGPLPAVRRGAVTFGSFHNLAKVSEAVVALWSRILREVPNSRMYLKSRALADAAVAERYRKMFAAHGIAPERVKTAGTSPRPELFAAHAELDIALDPFPFGGGITTLNSLWSGVPVLTLRGQRFSARFGESLVSAAGLAEWVAQDANEYVKKAVAAANDLPALATLRRGLRDQFLASPLCDRQSFTRSLEQLYDEFWARRTR